MKLTVKQVSDLYIDAMNSHPGMVKSEIVWTEFTEHLNAIIELEMCHELALAQNVAVDTVIEWINDTNNVSVSRQAEYNGMFMKPAPPPLTRAELLRHMLENEYNGREVYQGLEINYFEDQWSSIAEHCDIDLQHPENYRIIK